MRALEEGGGRVGADGRRGLADHLRLQRPLLPKLGAAALDDGHDGGRQQDGAADCGAGEGGG